MPPTDVVADASVVLSWFHEEGEQEVEASRAILRMYRSRRIGLLVLDLTAYEIGNVLLRGRPAVPPAGVAEVLDALAAICPRVTLTSAELADAAAIAHQHGLTFYDAAYAAVARSRSAVLVTLDTALLRVGLGQRPSAIMAAFAG